MTSAMKREFSGLEDMPERARGVSNATLRFLGALDPPISSDAFEALKELVSKRPWAPQGSNLRKHSRIRSPLGRVIR